MKTLSTTVILLALSLFALTGCGSGGDEAAPAEKKEAAVDPLAKETLVAQIAELSKELGTVQDVSEKRVLLKCRKAS